jgi:hypothetical protein
MSRDCFGQALAMTNTLNEEDREIKQGAKAALLYLPVFP